MVGAPQTTEHPIHIALRNMESEMRAIRTERDGYRDRWLKQVDVNDRLRGSLAEDALRMHALEAMCRE